MTHTPHELAVEFPDDIEAIHDLKTTKGNFAKLFERYHETNREIHRIESEIAPTSDDVLEDLKDEISAMIYVA